MHKFIKISLITICLFIFSGCVFVKNMAVEIPEYTDFSLKNEAFYYDLNNNRDLTADLNVCTTRFEITDYEGDQIKVEVFYDDQEDRNQINFSFNDDDLIMNKTNQKNNNCSFIRKIDSYVRISLPRTMNIVLIDINAYSSLANLNNLNFNELRFEHVNGNVEFSGEVNKLNVNLVNGNIDVDHLISGNSNLNTTNGTITLTEGEITSLEVQAVNGNITLTDLQNLSSAKLNTVNGKVYLNNINHEVIDTISSVSIEAKTTNGEIKLTNVYAKTVELSTVNGNISYYNENKTFRVDNVYYQKVNGDISFDINGNVSKK